jgi:hypothetical protein
MMQDLIIEKPVIFLENQEEQAACEAILRLSIKLSKSGQCCADLELNNWGNRNGVPDYLFFQDARFSMGKALKVKVGAITLFDGLTSAVNAHYAQNTAPTIGLMAATRRVFDSSNTTRLVYRQQLLEFEVKESWQAGRFWSLFPGRQTVSGEGKAAFTGQLVPGARVDLAGLGDKFGGTYRLNEVTHSFDQAHGWRTEFSVERSE